MTAASAPATRTARCGCGALSATAKGEPAIVAMCSCTACQRRTGAPFGTLAWWDAADVAVTGTAQRYARVSERGRTIAYEFCPTCGSALVFRGEHLPGKVGIAIGGFADPAFPAPTVAVWDTTRHHWLDAIAAIPRLAEQRS
ncbi:GFA family protein [Acuticoccus sediminis]|nr:GFA family protein [Acuticoccus sediminis]